VSFEKVTEFELIVTIVHPSSSVSPPARVKADPSAGWQAFQCPCPLKPVQN